MLYDLFADQLNWLIEAAGLAYRLNYNCSQIRRGPNTRVHGNRKRSELSPIVNSIVYTRFTDEKSPLPFVKQL